jgi:hypothetical protein
VITTVFLPAVFVGLAVDDGDEFVSDEDFALSVDFALLSPVFVDDCLLLLSVPVADGVLLSVFPPLLLPPVRGGGPPPLLSPCADTAAENMARMSNVDRRRYLLKARCAMFRRKKRARGK